MFKTEKTKTIGLKKSQLCRWYCDYVSRLFIFIFITAIHIDNGACIIQQASQSGALHTFKSYEDVLMLHFNVPKQVVRATWQFIAFSENECPRRTVNIYLKSGSYPAISVNNASHLPQMYTDNNDTIQVSMVTDHHLINIAKIVPVYSPEPGDWFVGAYLSHWDKDVHQKGLGVDCTYNLVALALWSETVTIENIPLGYQVELKTSETISYFKIFIPMNTLSFQIDVWGCSISLNTTKNIRGPCIKNVSVKGKSMPYNNHSEANSHVTLTPVDTYTFEDSSPFQDEWYYLMIVSNNPIKFNVKVTVTECLIKTMEESPFRQNQFKNVKGKFSKGFNGSEYKEDRKVSILNDNRETCIPQYQLVRIKENSIFSGDYLFKSREWLTSWLTLSDRHPIVTQFDVLPLVDIGGTLSIAASLEMDKVMTKQRVDVLICLNRGRVPRVREPEEMNKCDNVHTTIHLSNDKSNHFKSLLIPYPKPDTWYILLHARCLVNGFKVRCEMEEIMVLLKIKLTPCMNRSKKSCGDYGECQEIHKGLLYYTACKCYGGRQGLTCTDTTNAMSDFAILLETLLLTLSNLFFIPAVYIALRRKFYAEGFVYICTMLFSAFYHACDQNFYSYCIAKYEVLQYCDFFSGILSFWVTLIAMANLSKNYLAFFHVFGVIVITIGVQSDKGGLLSVSCPLVIGSIIVLTSHVHSCFMIKQFMLPKNKWKLTFGLILATIGILLFCLVETESNYKYVHSAWHAIIASSLVLLLPANNENQIHNGRSEDDMECSESSSSSVFHIDIASYRHEHLVEPAN
ncbi:post-GPI attachment to proteins factor 6-like [Trichogramma pretiosum]|uniref:post-GPI attachment to proteins factor 6-like n=1 Tax=Trichogramma pretiosum TaxID=7493 RepID=UPI0006C977F1|nr:post-GPI attachment to proteins factor 6-like [Trichogramma pretiosum]